MRNLALYRLCGALCATVNQSNQFLPVTRQLSVTGERERCSILTQGGDASAWPPFCWIVAYKDRVEKRTTETMGRVGTQRLRPTRPPGRSGPLDRTAGGIGGAAPASLDLYGQSRTTLTLRFHLLNLLTSLIFVTLSFERNRLLLKSIKRSRESNESRLSFVELMIGPTRSLVGLLQLNSDF